MTAIDPVAMRREMDKEGVTASDLAAELDVSLSYVCDLLSGRRRAKRNPVLRLRIADALNCRVSTICIADENDPTPPAQGTPRQRLDRQREHQLYRLWAADQTLLYIGISHSAVARMTGHAGKPWWLDVSNVTIESLGRVTKATALAREMQAIKQEKPLHNVVGANRPTEESEAA